LILNQILYTLHHSILIVIIKAKMVTKTA